jgi:DNA-binding transcriptional MerR regulator
MTTTINDVARVLGVSVRGIRLRVDALDGMLDPHLRQGENNRTLFDGEALAILRRLEDLRQAGSVSIRQAASRIREELDGNGADPSRQSTSIDASSEILCREIEDLRHDRDRWRDLALKLEDRVAALTPLALPRSRRWFGWIRGRRISRGSA